MITAVDIADINVVVKTHAPLAHMGALSQHHIGLGAVGAILQRFGKGNAVVAEIVPDFQGGSQKLLYGGGQIRIVVEALYHRTPVHSWPADDQRDSAYRLIRHSMLAVYPQFSHILAVVRGDDDGKLLIIKPVFFHPAQNLPHIVIGVADTLVIGV